MMSCVDRKSTKIIFLPPFNLTFKDRCKGSDVNKHRPHDSRSPLDQWRQASFILFDLGAMNLIAGAGAAFSYSIPLYVLGFRSSSFWLGLLFVLAGLACWKLRRLPIIVPLLIIAGDLWNTVRMLPLFDRAGYIVLVQTSFVLPLVFMLVSMLRARLKRGSFSPVHPASTPGVIHGGKEILALLTSMLVSVGAGLTALLLFSNYGLTPIAEATNPFINMFHDLLLVPLLLLLFPLGAALGELVWVRVSGFYLSDHEISNFIRYLKQIPLMSKVADRMLKHDASAALPNSALPEFIQTRFNQAVVHRKHRAINQRTWRTGLLFFVPLILIWLVKGLMFLHPLEMFDAFHHAEASEVTAPPLGALVVSKSGSGDYRSINAALAEAAPGAVILVRPGVYHESVLIDKAVTLAGEETAAALATIECAKDGCVRLNADGATLRNLAVHVRLSFWERWLGSEELTAIIVTRGGSLIENCDVSSNSGIGIVVSGSRSEPEIRNVKIHDCRLNGLLFTDQSRGVVENSDIYRNGWAGIRSEKVSQPVVRRSQIHNGQMDGVVIAMRGGGTFEDCEMFENNYNGVSVKEASSVTLNHSRTFNQKGAGIFVHDRSSARVEDCETFGNAKAGIEIADQGDAQVVKSKVHHGQTMGIIIWRGSTATVEDSLIYENNSTGLLVAGGSKPTIRKSTFRSHIYSAIEVRDGSNPTIEQCQIYGGRSSGIFFHDGGNGRVEECSIFGNMGANVVITSGSNPEIQNSSFSESQQAGLLVRDGGRGMIKDCRIFNNYVGVEIKENGAPSVQRCKINNNRHQGVTADGVSAGSVTASELTGNSGGAWKVDDRSQLIRSQNLE